MTYELAKELKDMGFPQNWEDTKQACMWVKYENDELLMPSLSQLIEACGNDFESLEYAKVGTEDSSNTAWLEKEGRWIAVASDEDGITIEDTSGHTPEEAVAKLYLALHEKKD